MNINANCSQNETVHKFVWKYNQCNIDNLNTEIDSYDWLQILDNNNINHVVDLFTIKLQDIMRRHIPHKSTTIKPTDKPWYNSAIKSEINKRGRLYQKFRRNKNLYNMLRYKVQDRRVQNMIEVAKKRQYDDILEGLDLNTKSKQNYWVLIRKLLGNKFSSTIPTMIDPNDNTLCTSNYAKANLFLQTLSDKYHDPYLNYLNLPQFPDRCANNIILEHTNATVILKLINNLEIGKACGPDNITNKMLKMCGRSISPILAVIYNKIIDDGAFPDLWKFGTVSVIHKKDQKNDPNNYRPITLLSTISKMFEKIIFDAVLGHCLENNLIYTNQSGFLPGHSTSDQLIAITSFISDNFQDNNDVRAVFLDIAAAFDTIPHHLLLHKLKAYGIRDKFLTLISSYLQNRKIRVRVNGAFSDPSPDNFINCGVPQGSLLGPLFFLLYINDLPDMLQCIVLIC